MKVTDNRTITVEIDGTEHTLTINDARELHRQLTTTLGLRDDLKPNVYPTYPINVPTWPVGPRVVHHQVDAADRRIRVQAAS